MVTDVSNPPQPLAATLPLPDVYQALGSQPQGLTVDEAQRRLQEVGPNAIAELRGTPLWVRFLANFTHLMALLLWVGGLVAFIAQLPQLGLAIWLVNVINGVFSFWQEFKAERATEALRQMLAPFAHALRDGEEIRLPADQIVPGDVILLAEGDRVPADGRLVEEAELRIDQSTLSGEAAAVTAALGSLFTMKIVRYPEASREAHDLTLVPLSEQETMFFPKTLLRNGKTYQVGRGELSGLPSGSEVPLQRRPKSDCNSLL